MTRKRHPNSEIERAIKYAEAHDWEARSAGKSPRMPGEGCTVRTTILTARAHPAA